MGAASTPSLVSNFLHSLVLAPVRSIPSSSTCFSKGGLPKRPAAPTTNYCRGTEPLLHLRRKAARRLTVLELPVSLQAHARAQVVEDQRLLGFRHSEFPRETGPLDGRPHLRMSR